MNELELTCFNIITNVGSAKSFYIEAIVKAKEGEFNEALALVEEGEKAYLEGHKAHTELIQKEANGQKVEVSLLLLHSEDQLITADSFKIIAKEFIDVYKKIG